MGLYNSRLILSKNIKLNKNYNEVLGFEESDMLNLVRANKIVELNNFSFLGANKNTIQVDIPISTVMNSNYIAFQNPYYSNKWYFAFIDDIIYISDITTEIRFTIDIWSTWYSYWNISSSFVVREHVSDDSIGANIVHENIDTGDFINNRINDIYFTDDFGTNWYVVESIKKPNATSRGYSVVGGNLMQGAISIATSASQFKAYIDAIDNDSDNGNGVINAWIVPSIALASHRDSNGYLINYDNPVHFDIPFTKLDTLDGYSPVNNKLKTSQFMYMILRNGGGSANILNYEDFSTSTCNIRTEIVATPGASSVSYPLNYKKESKNYKEGLVNTKFPLLSWTESFYQQWLSKNALDNEIGIIGLAGKYIAGVGTTFINPALGVGLMGSAGLSALSMMKEQYDYSRVPDNIRGNVNAGDISLSMGINYPSISHMSIKSKNARRIDKYFTRFGYAILEDKTPNIYGRSNYNYVQVSDESTACIINNHNNISIPHKDLTELNKLFKRGITIWHNHENFGNYNVSNSIV